MQDLQLSSQVSRTQYQYTIEDADPNELAAWAPQVLERLKQIPELADVASDQQNGALQMTLVIDRDSASRMGITAQAIDDTLYDAFGQRPVSTIFTQLNLYRVILEVSPEYQSNPDGLSQIYMRATTGDAVPLSAFVHFEQTQTAVSIAHEGQFPAVTLSFNLAPGAALGDAVQAIKDAVAGMGAPVGLHADFQGAAAAFGDSLSTEPLLILAAIITVYIVLGVLYESYIHPITILSTLPSAGVGAFLALLICHSEFSIIALIGIVLLIGIVKKNAIMMIDFALEAEREQGKSPREAIHQACLLRFRPIMMTTMAALLGGVPLALGTGTGAELRRPLGITIVGGLLVSQVLTLFTTPVIYLYMERLAARFRRGPKPSPEPRGRPAPPRAYARARDAMNISAPFVRRPIATSLLAAAVILAGLVAYRSLPVAPLPRVDFPTIQVSGALPGASPDTMASSVATPLERRFGRIAGLTEMTSVNTLGSTSITLQFDLDRDITGAARDVQAAINASLSELPPNLPSLPNYRKVNPADSPILILSLTSKTLPLAQVFDAANSVLAQKISQIDGVGQVFVGGGQQPAVRVQIDQEALAGHGLSLEDVRAALASSTANQPKGTLTGANVTYNIAATDQLLGADAYRQLIVSSQNGATIRLGDVANVFDDVENNRLAGWIDGERCVLMIIRRQPGANILSTIEGVKKALPFLQRVDLAGHRRAGRRRSHHHHPRLGPRRRADADPERPPGDGRGLRLPAQRARHRHPPHRRAAVAGRDLRRHVPARLQHRQPVADGADHLDRLRRRRRHRRHREHRPPHRGWKEAARGGAGGGAADRLHHRLHHRVADRRVHPDLADGRDHRAAVPRVRRHAEHRGGAVGARLADGDADDGRAPLASGERREARLVRPHLRARLRGADARLRPGASAGCSATRCSCCC